MAAVSAGGELFLDITWVNRGLVIARADDRTLRVGGEWRLQHNPDFMIYARTVTC